MFLHVFSVFFFYLCFLVFFFCTIALFYSYLWSFQCGCKAAGILSKLYSLMFDCQYN